MRQNSIAKLCISGLLSGKGHLTEGWMLALTMQKAFICDLLRAPHSSPKYRGVLAESVHIESSTKIQKLQKYFGEKMGGARKSSKNR